MTSTLVNIGYRGGMQRRTSPETGTDTVPATGVEACCPGSAAELLPETDAARLATVFKALSDPTRVRLLQYLAESEAGTACACHLPDALGISQPTLSFHMHKLFDADLVSREQRGRWVHWTVRTESLDQIRPFLDVAAT